MNLHGPLKFVKVETNDEQSTQNFIHELCSTISMQVFNPDPNYNPNLIHDKLENIIQCAKDQHLPIKTIRFNKYKHKNSPWVTNGILRSIKISR